jgi:hypothetical protein
MRQFIVGMVLGSLLTGGLGMASTLYDRNGNLRAPAGSQQSFDYFRQRGVFLDLQRLRQHSDRMAADRQRSERIPCAK